jgi:geranylgeranyl diphosphate synthase type II
MNRAQVVPEILGEYGAICRRAVRRYLSIRGDRGAEYLGDALRDYPERGGRSLRSSLCIAVARAFGASIDDALDSAVALEMMHNSFLIHDDVEDDSEVRRGRPTLHVLHGVPIAINVGDALTVLSLRPFLRNRSTLGARLSLRILEEAEQMARETVEGQAIELGWRRANTIDLGDDDYLRMVLKKTCWYTTIFPTRVGALIGSRDGVDLEPFLRFGFFVGAAFQIQDDLLNLIGDRAQYGKEIGGDLWEGKRTLMIIHLLNQANDDEVTRLSLFLATPRADKRSSDATWVRDLMDSYGSVAYCQQVAHGLAGAATLEFERGFAGLPESRDLSFVRELPAWVISRA